MSIHALNAHAQQSPASAEQTLLAQLIEIKPPEAIGFWPLSISALAILILLCVATAMLYLYGREKWQKNTFRRQALTSLRQLHSDYQKSKNNDILLPQLIHLLKRVLGSTQATNKHVYNPLWGKAIFTHIYSSLPDKIQKKIDVSSFIAWEKASYDPLTPLTTENADALFLFTKLSINHCPLAEKNSISLFNRQSPQHDDATHIELPTPPDTKKILPKTRENY